ncbi:hypothetical protein ME788_12990 [Lactobacillus delbrueckii]|uniref:Rep family protein n=1 Tax=Lactobacillus delbrueckii TaxID=1584 RepID=UPI00177D5636|nr:Rep family protein [Lactobacillus delbrueckii]MBD5835851.1 hypothetical protein [Lactobacillus delbrueckii]GHN24472.1 hypothetical protein ME786_10880 [Lactobacillus delbrueckii]GHN26995.1 hypothetical protein ME787_17100 [Lactobacillus delbrueckii]GHN28487.1 hypothetical protein ME788_12990 [Lactobacillus delbrueckii]
MSNDGISKLKQLSDSANTKKETGKKSTVRGNVFEVCQDLKNFDTEPDFSKCAESTGADAYMWLIHDHDVYSEEDLKALESKGLDMTKYHLGDPKNNHVHVFMHFKNPTTLPKIAKAFGVPDQYVNHWSGRNAWNNAVSYLTHRTDGAQGKYQYDPSDVHANFDYTEKLDSITQKIETLNAHLSRKEADREFERLVSLYASDAISFSEFENRLSDPSVKQLAADNFKYLHDLKAIQDRREALRFFDIFDQPQRVIWLYGDTGSGKSLAADYMASHFARKRYPKEPPLDNSYQVLGSSRGVFDRYSSAVHCIILDDLRPSNAFTYDDLLRIFDPHTSGPRQLPARYHDKLQATGIIIVTSKYDPAEFSYRLQKAWSNIQMRLMEIEEHAKTSSAIPFDSTVHLYSFDDIDQMFLDPGHNTTYYKSLSKNDPNAIPTMKALYDNDLNDVHHITANGDLRSIRAYSLSVVEALSRGEVWNLADSPAQLMRRVTTYKVGRRSDDAVIFQKMRPVRHDNGYCEYEEYPNDSTARLSLEDVWEGRRLEFNAFSDSSPYNPYSDEFSLDYNDETLSEETDFMLRFRKTYLYIHGEDRNRYLDQGEDPVIEAREEYDQQAFDLVLNKIREQVDMM